MGMGSKLGGFNISETKTVGYYLAFKPVKFEYIFRRKTHKICSICPIFRLNFGQHITDLVARCKKDLNLIRMLRGTDFVADKNSLLILYKS